MKFVTFLAILLSILFLTFVLPRKIQEYKLSQSQARVTVTVIQLPNCASGYRNKFIDIRYEGKNYSIRTKCKYVDALKKGQEIVMLHKIDSDIFLFPNEDTTSELLSTISLVVVFTLCGVALLFKKK